MGNHLSGNEWELPALPWEFIPKGFMQASECSALLVACWKAANQSESRVDQRVAVSSQQHEVKL